MSTARDEHGGQRRRTTAFVGRGIARQLDRHVHHVVDARFVHVAIQRRIGDVIEFKFEHVGVCTVERHFIGAAPRVEGTRPAALNPRRY